MEGHSPSISNKEMQNINTLIQGTDNSLKDLKNSVIIFSNSIPKLFNQAKNISIKAINSVSQQNFTKEERNLQLQIQGQAIRLIQQLDTIQDEQIINSKVQISIAEMKKQGKVLRKLIQSLDYSNFHRSFLDKTYSTPLSLKESNIQFEAKISTLQNEIKQQNELIRSLKSQLEISRAEARQNPQVILNQTTPTLNPSLSTSFQNNHISNFDIQAYSEEKKNLEAEIRKQTDKLRDYFVIKSDLDDAKQEIIALKYQKKEVEEYANVLDTENKQMKQTIANLKIQLDSGSAGFDALNNKLQKLQAEADEAASLKRKLENAQSEAMKTELLLEQITTLKTELFSSEEKISQLKKQIVYQRNDVSNEIDNTLELEKESLQELQKNQQIDELKESIEKSNIQIREKDAIINKYKEKQSQQKETMMSLSEKFTRLAETTKNYKTQLKENVTKLNEYENQIYEQKTTIQKQKRQIQSMVEEISILNIRKKERNEFEQKLKQTDLAYNSLKNKFNLLESTLKKEIESGRESEKEIDDLRNECSKMKIQSQSDKNTYIQEKLDLQNQLEECQKQLLDNQINFEKIENEKANLTSKLTRTEELMKSQAETFEVEKEEMKSKFEIRTKAKQNAHEHQVLELKNQIEETRKELNNSHEQIAKMNEEISLLKEANNKTNQEFRQYQNELKSQFGGSTLDINPFDEIQRLKRNLSDINSSYNQYKLSISHALPPGLPDDPVVAIHELQKNLQTAKDNYNSFKNDITQLLPPGNPVIEISKIKQQLQNTEESYKSYQDSIKKLLPNGSPSYEIQKLLAAKAKLTDFENEIKDVHNRFSQFFVTNSSYISGQNSGLLEAFTMANNKIQEQSNEKNKINSVLRDIQSPTFEDIPRIIKSKEEVIQQTNEQLKNANSLINAVREAVKMDAQNTENLPHIVEQLRKNNNNLTDQVKKNNAVFRSIMQVLPYDKIENIPSKIQVIQKDNQKLSRSLTTQSDNAEVLSAKLHEIEKKTKVSKIDNLPDVILHLRNTEQLYLNLLTNLRKSISFQKEENIPEIVNKLAESDRILNHIKDLYFEQSVVVENLPSIVEKNKKELEVTKEIINQTKKVLGNSYSFEEDSSLPTIMDSFKQNLNSKNAEIEKINQRIISCETMVSKLIPIVVLEDIPNAVIEIKKKLDLTRSSNDELTQNHINLTSSLCSILNTNSVESISDAARKLTKDFNDTKVQLDNLTLNHKKISNIISSLKSLTNCASESDLPRCIQVLLESQKKYKESLPILTFVMQKLIVSSNNEVPQALTNLLSQIEQLHSAISDASSFVTAIFSSLSINLKLITNDKNLSFPMEKKLSDGLLNLFSQFVSKAEEIRSDYDRLMSQARSLGFNGTSCIEAADFLADDLCKKKAQEQLEEMVSQMKQLREDRDRERAVFEQRLNKSALQLKEVRQSKARLIDEYSAKQNELGDEIETLQRDLRNMQTLNSKQEKIREELVRHGSNEVFDRQYLIDSLSANEVRRLKL